MSSTELNSYMTDLGRSAKKAGRVLSAADSNSKNQALLNIAQNLLDSEGSLLAANQLDMAAGREKGLDSALLDRLELNLERIEGMAEGLRQVAALPDPVGEIAQMSYRPSGIQVGKMRVPLGVIGIIYESRPNVTADAAALCLKSGNATILRGGSEASHSNQAIAACITAGLEQAGLPADAVQVVKFTDRAAVTMLIQMDAYVDVIVPRGGKGLIERITQDARVPVIKHLHGNCHLYVDSKASKNKAIAIAINAKTQRYGTCNTLESLLIHQDVVDDILPELASALQQKGVELRCCERSAAVVENAVTASDEDWYEEYLAPILSVRVLAGFDDAVEWIAEHSSGHTESIITEDIDRANRFLRQVDSSSVMVNTSTRFADGFEYGLGAEIGISTDKLHARGPVGLEGLTTQKYIVISDGKTRS